MQKLLILFFITIFFQSIAQETYPVLDISQQKVFKYAFTNAKIHTSYNTVIPNGTLLIEGDRIIDVGIEIKIPKDAIVYDLNGQHIYPSFVELIYSDGLKKLSKKNRTDENPAHISRPGNFVWNQAIRSDYTAYSNYNPEEQSLKKMQEMGFGAMVVHRNDGISRGAAVLVAANSNRTCILENEVAHFLSFSKGSSGQNYPGSLMGSMALLRQTYYDGQWYKNKIDENNEGLAQWNHLQTLPQIFYATRPTDLSRIKTLEEEFGVNYIIKSNGWEYKNLDLLKKWKPVFIHTLNFPKPFEFANPLDFNMYRYNEMKHWLMAPFNPRILNENKIQFSFSSEGIKDKDQFFKALKLVYENGLSKENILKALTYNPSKIIGKEKLLGLLAKGAYANFFICKNGVFYENVKINEHWVLGKRNILFVEHPDLIDGKYFLSTDTFQDTLNIKNKKIVVKDSLKFPIKLQDGNISFKFNDFFYYGKFEKNRYSGFFEDADYILRPWKMKNISKKENKEIYNEYTVNYKKSIPKICYPNSIYGYDQKPTPKDYLITNTTVWTSEANPTLLNTDVFIQNGKIKEIGKKLAVKNVPTIDGSGKFLTAGIIDEHSHIAIEGGVNECSHNTTSEVRVGDVLNPENIYIYRHLAGGVTTAQLLHGSCNPIGGQAQLIKMRWGENAENLKYKNAPPFIKFALGENVKRSRVKNNKRYPNTRLGVEQVYDDAFTRAKIYMNDKNPQKRIDLRLQALEQILRDERNISCHSYVQSEINMLMKIADQHHFKVNTFTHILEGYKVADKLKAHGANASTFSDWWAYKYEVIDAIPHNAAIMTNQGVNVCINSDDGEMGRRLNQEAAKSIKYMNMSESEAWNMVTINPAKALKIDKDVGSIKIGKSADLVLWSNNPLSIYAIVEKTWIDGVLYFDLENSPKIKSERMKEKRDIFYLMQNDKGEKIVPIIEQSHYYECDGEVN